MRADRGRHSRIYGSRMVGGEVLHMYSVMIVPPLFFGAVWFGYKRFVE